MRILQVIDSLDRSGGAEQALAVTAPGLVKRGIEVEVGYLLDREGFQEELMSGGVQVHAIRTPRRLTTIRALARLIRARSPDLVHTTLFEADVTGRLAARMTGTPVVSSLVNAAYGPEHRGDPRLRAWKVRLAQAADLGTAQLVRRFHAISNHVAATMSQRLRLRANRIDVIPRGRDPAMLATRTPEIRRTTRADLGISDDTPLVLAAARHEHQKGLDVLVAAMGVLARSVPDAALLVAGRFGLQTELIEETAQQHDVTRLCLLGPRADVLTLMGAADVFCAPSRWEGLGSAVVEAMGVGVPVVVSDVPALREAVGDENHARLVPPEDAAALGQALTATLLDRAAAERRAGLARQRFVERYTLNAVLDKMIAFYERALNGRRMPR